MPVRKFILYFERGAFDKMCSQQSQSHGKYRLIFMHNILSKNGPILLKPIALAFMLALLPGCGGGGGGGHKGGANAVEPGGGVENTTDEGNGSNSLNKGLNGAIYYTRGDSNAHVKLDLATGLETIIPQLSGSVVNTSITRLVEYDIDEANQQIVVAHYSNYLGDSQVSIDSLDKNFEVKHHFFKYGTDPASLRVSPDGKYVSMRWWPDDSNYGRYLMVFDREGQKLWETMEISDPFGGSRPYIRNHVWLNDNSGILISEGNAIFIVDWTKNAERRIIRDFDPLGLQLNWALSISPDGSRIAFNLSSGRGEENTHIYTMKTDGSDLKQITNGVDGESEATWSLDGNTIFVVSGGWETQITKNCSGRLFAVSADSELAVLPEEDSMAEENVTPIFRKSKSGGYEGVCVVSELMPEWNLQ